MNNIDWIKIKTECPKGFEMFYKTLDLSFMKETNSIWFKGTNYDPICFCDIVDFFDGQGIIISIVSKINHTTDMTEYHVIILKIFKNFMGGESLLDNYKTRPEAQTEAVYKAFQIYEERLK